VEKSAEQLSPIPETERLWPIDRCGQGVLAVCTDLAGPETGQAPSLHGYGDAVYDFAEDLFGLLGLSQGG
jgi:hypothetical protein